MLGCAPESAESQISPLTWWMTAGAAVRSPPGAQTHFVPAPSLVGGRLKGSVARGHTVRLCKALNAPHAPCAEPRNLALGFMSQLGVTSLYLLGTKSLWLLVHEVEAA